MVLVNGSTIGSGPYSNVAFAYPQNDTSFIRVVFASGISVSVQVRVGTLAVVLSGKPLNVFCLPALQASHRLYYLVHGMSCDMFSFTLSALKYYIHTSKVLFLMKVL